MEHPTLEALWAHLKPRWQPFLAEGSMPFYRNWTHFYPWHEGGAPLRGLPTLLLAGSPYWGPCTTATNGVIPGRPVAWRGAVQEGELTMVPLFPAEAGSDWEAPVPQTGAAPGVPDLFESLGYRLEKAEVFSLDGKTFQVPEPWDPLDGAAETVRLGCHREWAARGGTGYLGGEWVLGLLACDLGVDLSSLECWQVTLTEFAATDAANLAYLTLQALSVAADLLIEGFGDDRGFFHQLTLPVDNSQPSDSPGPNEITVSSWLDG